MSQVSRVSYDDEEEPQYDDEYEEHKREQDAADFNLQPYGTVFGAIEAYIDLLRRSKTVKPLIELTRGVGENSNKTKVIIQMIVHGSVRRFEMPKNDFIELGVIEKVNSKYKVISADPSVFEAYIDNHPKYFKDVPSFNPGDGSDDDESEDSPKPKEPMDASSSETKKERPSSDKSPVTATSADEAKQLMKKLDGTFVAQTNAISKLITTEEALIKALERGEQVVRLEKAKASAEKPFHMLAKVIRLSENKKLSADELSNVSDLADHIVATADINLTEDQLKDIGADKAAVIQASRKVMRDQAAALKKRVEADKFKDLKQGKPATHKKTMDFVRNLKV